LEKPKPEPTTVTPLMVRFTSPEFFKVTFFVEVVSRVSEPKLMDEGERVAAASAFSPVPVKETGATVFTALEAILREAVAAPATEGVKDRV
jgi:hypothetical protein